MTRSRILQLRSSDLHARTQQHWRNWIWYDSRGYQEESKGVVKFCLMKRLRVEVNLVHHMLSALMNPYRFLWYQDRTSVQKFWEWLVERQFLIIITYDLIYYRIDAMAWDGLRMTALGNENNSRIHFEHILRALDAASRQNPIQWWVYFYWVVIVFNLIPAELTKYIFISEACGCGNECNSQWMHWYWMRGKWMQSTCTN